MLPAWHGQSEQISLNFRIGKNNWPESHKIFKGLFASLKLDFQYSRPIYVIIKQIIYGVWGRHWVYNDEQCRRSLTSQSLEL